MTLDNMVVFSSLITTVINYFIACQPSPTPLVLWHGLGDAANMSFTTGCTIKLIKARIPGIHVHSISMGNSMTEDIFHSYFGSVDAQVSEACRQISSDPKLQHGYNAIGFSQGSQFLRAVAQRCPNPRMKNLISIGGQHQGIYGVPECIGMLCSMASWLMDLGAHTWFSQNYFVVAQYWHNPLDEQRYRQSSSFLADINNENELKESYRTNLMKLENFVMVKFENDNLVIPVESQWFGFYSPGQSSVVESLRESRLYKEDRLGLREMDEAKKLHFLSLKGKHLQFSIQWFLEEIVDVFLT